MRRPAFAPDPPAATLYLRRMPSWLSLSRLPLSELTRQVEHTEALLDQYRLRGSNTRWFRPGHGWFTPAMLDLCRAKGLNLALGSVFGNDPWVRSVPLLARWYAHRAYPGAILIIHDGQHPAREQTVPILDTALPVLRGRGYRVTTLSGLFQHGESARER